MNYQDACVKMDLLELPDPLCCPNIADFNLICRICLRKSSDTMQMQPIHSYKDNLYSRKRLNLSKKIQMCSDIKIEENGDIFPKNICNKCVNLLLVAQYFRILSATSDKILKNIVNKIGTESQINKSADSLKIELDFQSNFDEFNYEEDCFLNDLLNEDSNKFIDSHFICDVCLMEFFNKSALSDHIHSHFDTEHDHDNKPLYCELPKTKMTNVNQSTADKRMLQENNMKENGDSIKCLVCNTSFEYKEDLSRHMFSHDVTTSKYKCYGCNVVYDKYSERTHHEKFYCPKMPPGTKYQCRICKTQCDNRFRFDLHLKSGCSLKQEKSDGNIVELKPLLKCEHCIFTTTSKWNLNYHILNCHTKDKPYVCEICGKSYAIGWRLTKHYKQSHQPKEKKFKCTHCPYATVDQSSLRVHNRRHTLEYRFSCEVCGASFKHSSGYHSHVRRYHRDKEHQCEYCNRMFSLKASLKSHVASVHLGIKPFDCKHCGMGFTRKRTLKDHLLRTHRVNDEFILET